MSASMPCAQAPDRIFILKQSSEEGHTEYVVRPARSGSSAGRVRVQRLLLGVGTVGGRERQLEALCCCFGPELHELGGDGRVHDDRATVQVRGAVEGAQADRLALALVVRGSSAVVRAGQESEADGW